MFFAFLSLAWRSEGLPLTTSSNDAAKMFDATLTQYTGWYDDSSVNGIEGSVSKMLAADPNFVMGHVISCGLDLISSGKGIYTDQELKSSMLSLEGLTARSNITNRETACQGSQRMGRRGLELNPRDCWSTHAEAHVIEMDGRQDEGIKFLSTTSNDWTVGKRCLSGAMLDLVDASSLLYRLQMEGVDVNDRWRELFHLWESHTDDHILEWQEKGTELSF
ncbi:Tetratricopeptide repeat protein 38 [Stylophora pistillata]|uniref:Tetratricopeptide repeat protein 38 n=1 Tax=Stylophora pistillata TaxID=50429 RepID=A0A2B4RFE8_STYPI|nr:Tetratricopeptide repeat protein 38 [Stylophora pistillata]